MEGGEVIEVRTTVTSYPARDRTWNKGTKIPCVTNYTTG